MPLIWNFLSAHLQNRMDVLKNFKLPALKICDTTQHSLLLSSSDDHKQLTGHPRCGFYSPKKQEECKSQEEGDEREGVAHGVHQLQGGQQGKVIHLDTGRADMTTRMESAPHLQPSSKPRATMGLGTSQDLL